MAAVHKSQGNYDEAAGHDQAKIYESARPRSR